MKSRRHFLRVGAIAALAAAIPQKFDLIALAQGRGSFATDVVRGFPVPSECQADPLFYLRLSSFSPYVNTIFEAQEKKLKSKTVPLTLVEASAARGTSKRSKLVKSLSTEPDCFSLLFRGSLPAGLTQDVYEVRHYALGQLQLLLVPVVNRDTGERYYEAIFNRSHP